MHAIVILPKYVKKTHKVQTQVNDYIIAFRNKKHNLTNAANRVYIYKKANVYLMAKCAN